MGVKNKCEICGEPCKSKYCKACAKKAYRENAKISRQAKAKLKYHGCNEDCEHCTYPDCLKPAHDMKPTRDVTDISRVDRMGGESQGRMFTLELGGYGGARPNISKKFYL